jgi:sugar phosphate isomerase/epimerase
MFISLVTDEISADPETAFELGTEWGVHDFELRSFGVERVPLLAPYQKDRLKELIAEFQARIVAISPGLFKIPLPRAERERFALRVLDSQMHSRWLSARELLQRHVEELLPASLDYACQVGAEIVVVFGLLRDGLPAGPAPEVALELFRHAAERAAAAGLTLAIEVEEGTFADTGAHTAEILRAVDHPALAVNWDPGNAIVSGESPYPDGYAAVRGRVRHVHFKDVVRDLQTGGFRYVVSGEIDWEGQIRALADDGYKGAISIETHQAPKVRRASETLRRVRELMALARPGGVPA